LIGSPPGYVGYEEGGQLTEAVRHKPYSVVLFDEIEKAHPDVFNILLQVLDDGRLTDSKGRNVDFKNTIIIMTSNLGSHIIQEGFERMKDSNREDVMEEIRAELLELLKKTVRPEFLNRIDETIIFTPLTRADVRGIVKLQFDRIIERVKGQGIEIQITEPAIDWISSIGFDPQYGARPVKRVLQKYILNELSKKILSGDVDKEKPVVVDVSDNKLVFTN
jgi:ATP-dependent Clp protease ATP-binding subunit ClpB